MARSTGPILAAGTVTIVNRVVFNTEPVDWRVPIGVGIAAVSLALIERVSEPLAVGVAWIALITTLIAPVGATKSPVESALDWWNQQ